MLFNSFQFLVFMPVVALLYRVIPARARYLWLLAASYYFYMCWNAGYALLLLFSTLATWGCALLVHKAEKTGLRKAALGVCIGLNLAILFFFKYFNFFLENVNAVLGMAGMQALERPFDVLLPVGISFYIFQALGYTIDVYRGKVEPERNVLRYALFVSFFPQLVAGPIERSGNLMGQLRALDKQKPAPWSEVTKGVFLICWGMFLKMVVADRAANLANVVFGSWQTMGSAALGAGAVAFALQIYGDFCGYSTIAMGAARCFGIKLMDNFETPYFATSIQDFWRRWHVSLSGWFRDYVYIPLGGNRKGRVRKYANLMITFLLSGLWHGASWHYVVWGALHGVYQVIGDLTKETRRRLYRRLGVRTEVFSFRLGQVLCTFMLTCIAWVFFRAATLQDAVGYLTRLVTRMDPWALFDGTLFKLGLDAIECSILNVSVMVMLGVDLLKLLKKRPLEDMWSEQGMLFRWIVLWVLMGACLVLGVYGVEFSSAQFLYFQF